MGASEIPVDLANPGQVFACLGFMEAADILIPGARVRSTFDWAGETLSGSFRLVVDADEEPVAHVLRFLAEAEVVSLAPVGSAVSTDLGKHGVPTEILSFGAPYPCPELFKPAELPVLLRDTLKREIIVDHWCDDSSKTKRDNAKFWAGNVTAAGLTRSAIDLFRDCAGQAAVEPFAFMAQQSSSFRLDWRRDYIPLDSGFSPNAQPSVVMGGFPIVEVLAAIGLTHARPQRPDRRDKLRYRYGTLNAGEPVDPIFLRAALGCAEALPGAALRKFEMRLDWPGQENQARAIVEVIEIEGLSA